MPPESLTGRCESEKIVMSFGAPDVYREEDVERATAEIVAHFHPEALSRSAHYNPSGYAFRVVDFNRIWACSADENLVPERMIYTQKYKHVAD